MNQQAMQAMQKVNYWERPPSLPGYYMRQRYVQQILSYVGSALLKVLVGQRRSGKSTILKHVIAALMQQGVPAQNILYLNFELYALQFIRDAATLSTSVELYLSTLEPQGVLYFFFDEIQEVDGWEKVVNSFLANERVKAEIFLTGSNAHLLSTELSTYVTGRYVEIPIFPFSYAEYIDCQHFANSRSNLIAYMESSGLPELFHLKNEEQKSSYFSALRDSIIMHDIIKRFQVKHHKFLDLLFDFIIDNVGSLFSFNSIVKKIKSSGTALTVSTVSNYVHYLERTLMIHSVQRYDIKRKKILEGERKYYLNDLGFKNYFGSHFDNAINRKLENYVFKTLLESGYEIYVGNIYHVEIDFIAEKNKNIIYIQVAYLLHSEEVVEREYGNLERIKDHFPKWVVSLDEVSFPPRNGIQHIQAWKLHEILERSMMSQ